MHHPSALVLLRSSATCLLARDWRNPGGRGRRDRIVGVSVSGTVAQQMLETYLQARGLSSAPGPPRLLACAVPT